MPKNNEFANGVNNSNPVSTATHEKGKQATKPRYKVEELTERELELESIYNLTYKKYKIEKEAKNQAYEFILSSGLFNEFNLFIQDKDRYKRLKTDTTLN